MNLRIPPLRERLDDILPLARFFLNQYAIDFKKKVSGSSPEAIEKIRRYAWPGNVRELQNSIERAVLLCDEETIGAHVLTLEGRAEGDAVKAGDTMNLEELERGAIQQALRAARGVQKDAADLLGITPRVLNYKIQTLGIDWKAFRDK